MNETNAIPTSKPDLWREFYSCWQQLPNKLFFFTLLIAWLGLFQLLGNSTFGYSHTPSLFAWMYMAYNTRGDAADDAYGNLIPFLVIGLFWWKRKELLALPLKIWAPASLIVALGIVLHIIAYLVQEPRLSIVALFIGIYGLMGLAWGPACLRHSFFPFFLFIFAVPLSTVSDFITFPLRVLVSTLTEWISHYIFGIGVMRQGTQLFDPLGTYQYDVAAACSGIRSLIAIVLLSTVYGFVVFRSTSKRLVMLALAIPFAVLGNLLRMLLIIVAAVMGGQEWGNYVHEGCPIHLPFNLPLIGNEIAVVNLLPYIPAFLGVLFLGRWLEKKPDSARNSQS